MPITYTTDGAEHADYTGEDSEGMCQINPDYWTFGERECAWLDDAS